MTMRNCLILLAISGLAACATQPKTCVSARTITAKYGRVIGCHAYTYPDNGEVVDRCQYVTSTGHVKTKHVFVRHCGL
jgi:hypothetical protein